LRCELRKENMTMKLNSFGINGVVVFQGTCSGVIINSKKKCTTHGEDALHGT
jgi:glutamine amidotransferase PdxT